MAEGFALKQRRCYVFYVSAGTVPVLPCTAVMVPVSVSEGSRALPVLILVLYRDLFCIGDMNTAPANTSQRRLYHYSSAGGTVLYLLPRLKKYLPVHYRGPWP